jgi:hypothetical protein
MILSKKDKVISMDTSSAENIMNRIAQLVKFNAPLTQIHDILVAEGLSETQAYLVFAAAKLLARR